MPLLSVARCIKGRQVAGVLDSAILKAIRKKRADPEPAPLIVELLRPVGSVGGWGSERYPFAYRVVAHGNVPFYEVACCLPLDTVGTVRRVVDEVSRELDPQEVEPLTFSTLVDVLTRHSAERLALHGVKSRVRETAELSAFEALGLSRILALAKDERVTEFFVDSDVASVYLDHAVAGRCETGLVLTQRERDALATHVDTFMGYTMDFVTPSMKNDLPVGGAVLRVSLDLEPVSVNRFSLDVRRLNMTSLTLPQLVALGVLSDEAAAFMVAWLETGGNITIVGETGTGKTTLLNALDEVVERRLRRLYIEDAVETKDLLEQGFHQMKVKVDPFERGEQFGRTKESEIVKALHRSPDIVILSEIQSEEHSRAFFQALASGARGIQTFHASNIEQAVRRWTRIHHVPEECLLDLGLLVQMARPDRLKQTRFVRRVSAVVQQEGGPKVREVFLRGKDGKLVNVAGPTVPLSPEGVTVEKVRDRAAMALERMTRLAAVRP